MQYYYSTDGTNQHGPASLDELARAQLSAMTLVWRDGLPQWTPAGELPELAALFGGAGGSAEPIPTSQDEPAQTLELNPPQPQWAQPTGLAAPSQVQGGYVAYQLPQTAMALPINGMAIASMVLGIVALVIMCFYGIGIVPGILAIIFGHIARGQIARGLGQGSGMALAGLITGYIAVSIVIIGIICIAVLIAAMR